MSAQLFINVQDYGVVPSLPDCTATFQAMLSSFPGPATPVLCFPPSTMPYKFSASPDFSAFKVVTLWGPGIQAQAKQGALITGNFAGALLNFTTTNVRVEIAGLTIYNTSAGGTAINITRGFACLIRGNVIQGGAVGVFIGPGSYCMSILDNDFGNSGNTATGVVYSSGGGGGIERNSFVGLNIGVQLNALSFVAGNRFEVNKTAVLAGYAADGTPNACQLVMDENYFEANDVFIQLNGTSGFVSNSTFHGSSNAPSGMSQYGVLGLSGNVCFKNCFFGGAYAKASVSTSSPSMTISFEDCQPQNAITTAPFFDLRGGWKNIYIHNAGVQQPVDYRLGWPSQHGPNLPSPVQLLNLGRYNEQVPPGATSFNVAFTTAHGASLVHSLTPSNNVSGLLAPGTYYYVCSTASARGEKAASLASELSVVVTAPNNAVTVTFPDTQTADGFVRRVYRKLGSSGQSDGLYNGYYQLPINSNGPFLDLGNPFDGLSNPMVGSVDETSMIESDANYVPFIALNFNSSWWITNLSISGFTVNFGTAAPGDGSGRLAWEPRRLQSAV